MLHAFRSRRSRSKSTRSDSRAKSSRAKSSRAKKPETGRAKATGSVEPDRTVEPAGPVEPVTTLGRVMIKASESTRAASWSGSGGNPSSDGARVTASTKSERRDRPMTKISTDTLTMPSPISQTSAEQEAKQKADRAEQQGRKGAERAEQEAKRMAEEQEASAKKKADEEASAKTKADEEAAAKKKVEEAEAAKKRVEEVEAAKKKAEEEAAATAAAAAAAKKKADEEAAAKKKASAKKEAGQDKTNAQEALQNANKAREMLAELKQTGSLKELQSLKGYIESLIISTKEHKKHLGARKYTYESADYMHKEALSFMERAIETLSEVQKELGTLYIDREEIHTKLYEKMKNLEVATKGAAKYDGKLNMKSIQDAEKLAETLRELLADATSVYDQLNSNDKRDLRDFSELIKRSGALTETLNKTAQEKRRELQDLVKEATDEVKKKAVSAERNLDAAKKAHTALEAKKAADVANQNARDAARLIQKINECGVDASTDDAKDSAEKAREYAGEATEYARSAHEEERNANTDMQNKINEARKDLGALSGIQSTRVYLQIIEKLLARQGKRRKQGKSAIEARIEEAAHDKIENLIQKEKTSATKKLAKEERQVQEENKHKARTLEEGIQLVIERTRHAIQGARGYKDNINIGKRKKVGPSSIDLLSSIDVVGAVLYSEKGEYAGVAVPVVANETHTTLMVTNKEFTEYALIEATSKQAALALGRYVAYNDNEKRTEYTADKGLTSRFLEHMFLDDIRIVEGDTCASAVGNFKNCLGVIGDVSDETRGSVIDARLITQSALDTIAQHTTQDNPPHTYYGAFRTVTLSQWESSLEKYIAAFSIKHKKGTHITPMGYYNDSDRKGHQCAVLVCFLKGKTDAIVAFADTGETALATNKGREDYVGEMAIVAVCKTTKETASGILEFVLDVHPHISQKEHLTKARNAILKRCGYIQPIEQRDQRIYRSTLSYDRHFAVRSMGCCYQNIVSHPQRGGTCTFYSTMWLIGVADALARDEGAVDFIVDKKAVEENTGVQKADALLASVCKVDKEIKKLGFAHLWLHENRSTAELVAADFAHCSWLDTKSLREHLYRARQWDMDPKLDDKCMITKVEGSPFVSSLDAKSTLGSIAGWIQTSGYIFDSRKDYVNGTASVEMFVYIARDVLVKPVSLDEANPDDVVHILTIAKYLAYLRTQSNLHLDTFVGMAMRCVRYMIHIVGKGSKSGVRYATGDRIDRKGALTAAALRNAVPDSVASAAKNFRSIIMPNEFTTSLPWAAVEYYDLQEECGSVTKLLFRLENIEYLTDRAKGGPREKQAIDMADMIISANDFHKTWMTSEKGEMAIRYQRAAEHDQKRKEAELRGDQAAALRYLKEQESRTREGDEIRARIDCANGFELTQTQLRALQYIKSDRSLTVLNIATALLNLPRDVQLKEYNNAEYFVFGRGENAMRFDTVDKSTMGDYEKGYKEYACMKSETLKQYTRHEGPDKPDSMESTAEYLFDATRDCSAKTRTTHDGEDTELMIQVSYPRPSVSLDVKSLVKWADGMNETIGECEYGDRGIAYVIKRHMLPLSANGPNLKNIESLKKILEKRDQSGSEEADAAVLLGHIQTILGGTVPRDGLNQIEAGNTKETTNLPMVLMHAYMAVAVIQQKLAEVMDRKTGGATARMETLPESSWSLTQLRLKENETHVTHDQTKHKFVFKAEGGGMARVHTALRNGNCRFDHWRVSDQLSIIQTSDAEIDGHVEVQLKLTEAVDNSSKKKITRHTLFTGDCEWWDPTFGSAVLPVTMDGGASVSGVVVIPGNYSQSMKSGDYHGLALDSDQESVVSAYKASLPSNAFLVTLDAAGLLPVASTRTPELMRLFVAYAYSGSRLGTRLMPCAAARSIYDVKPVNVPGLHGVKAHDAIRLVILGAACALGAYSSLALVYTQDAESESEITRDLRCSEADLASALVERLLSSAVHESDDPKRRAAFSFWAEYGEPERLAACEVALRKESDETKKSELLQLKTHTDEWMTTLSATTGRFVREDQREKIGQILKIPWSVVQMNMGFGKSSVIVPMLVARYICKRETKVVFVTQPPHLVPQAARTVGALIAAHPYVRDIDGSVTAVRTLNGTDMRKMIERWEEKPEQQRIGIKGEVGAMRYKLVVVLSTAELQCIVRDHSDIYKAHEALVHIADEVDAESDPLRCEVIIEGANKQDHYNKNIARSDNIRSYYQAACDLVFGADERKIDGIIKELDTMCTEGQVLAGTRLRNVYNSVNTNMVYRINYGLSDDESKIVAVPFEYAGTASRVRDFSDLDVAIVVFVLSIKQGGMRESDKERLEAFVKYKFRKDADTILRRLNADPELKFRFYLTQIAMSYLKMSPKERSVSFVDLPGLTGTLVGFSGTMGTGIAAPRFVSKDDPRGWCSQKRALVIDDDESNAQVDGIIKGAGFVFVELKQPSKERAKELINKIKENISEHKKPVCLVDGSGEFGVFENDIEALREGLGNVPFDYFDKDSGMLVDIEMDRTVRYYSHRYSRGTDSEMPEDTVGITLVALDSARRSDIAQAIYRLRKLGRSEQTVVLILASKYKIDESERTPERVLEKLVENESTYIRSASKLKKEQANHAANLKGSADRFDREVIYTDVHSASAQKQQETQKQTLIAKHDIKALEKAGDRKCYEGMISRENEDKMRMFTLLNRNTRDSDIYKHLEKTGIGLSPMITHRDLVPSNRIRRAFALKSVPEDTNRVNVVVISIAEAWAKYAHTSGALYEAASYDKDGLYEESPYKYHEYSYYTHDGALISGPVVKDDRAVLFGRFLCDDDMSIEEEIRLLWYLHEQYDTNKSLTEIIKCLLNSDFITKASILLRSMKDQSPRDILTYARKHVNILMEKVSAGSSLLASLLRPIVDKALGLNQAFGRDKGRALRLFV